MFLKKLYCYNKFAFVSFAIFLLAFIFINLKAGMVASPVILYGMYSSVYKKEDTVKAYHIYADNKPVNFSELNIAERDILETSLDFYLSEKEKNRSVFLTMKRILSKLFIGNRMKEENYVNHTDPQKFKRWYIHKTENIIGAPVNELRIEIQPYLLKTGVLTPAGLSTKIDHFVKQ